MFDFRDVGHAKKSRRPLRQSYCRKPPFLFRLLQPSANGLRNRAAHVCFAMAKWGPLL